VHTVFQQRHRPVHEIQVDIVSAELFQALVESKLYICMIFTPVERSLYLATLQLRRDPGTNASLVVRKISSRGTLVSLRAFPTDSSLPRYNDEAFMET
jgi:hypothetical protein